MKELREAIVKEMLVRAGSLGYCTWWFKFHIPYDTTTVRRELEKMKREGLVRSNHDLPNNTRGHLINWSLGEKT